MAATSTTRTRCAGWASSTGASAETEVVVTRAVVSGAAGFIASHLCERLLARGWEGIGIATPRTASAENVAPRAGHPRFRLIQHDISTPMLLDDHVDHVLHFASPASPV